MEIGSLMMEVHAAPSLQLFSGRGGVGGDGRASPLSRSVEDISSQLDRLTRTFHVASPPQATSPLPTTAAATFHSDARQADRATFHGGFGGCGAGGGCAGGGSTAHVCSAYPPASPSAAAAHNTYGRSRENSDRISHRLPTPPSYVPTIIWCLRLPCYGYRGPSRCRRAFCRPITTKLRLRLCSSAAAAAAPHARRWWLCTQRGAIVECLL